MSGRREPPKSGLNRRLLIGYNLHFFHAQVILLKKLFYSRSGKVWACAGRSRVADGEDGYFRFEFQVSSLKQDGFMIKRHSLQNPVAGYWGFLAQTHQL